MKTALTAFAAGLLLCGTASAGDGQSQECPTAKKVGELLAQWEAAAEQAKTASPEQRQEQLAKLGAAAQQCPVGSRMPQALSAVADVLGMVVASEQANAEHCPLQSAGESDESCAAAKEMKAYRSEALANLHRLASYAAGATCGSEAVTCPQSGKTVFASVKSECSEASASCPIKMASRLGALKASFATARSEAEALAPEKRNVILASFGPLAETSPCVALVPSTVAALAEGLEGLHQLHGKMAEWAQANPEVMAKLPDSARQAFMVEIALLDEARDLLASVTAAMQTMQPHAIKTAQATEGNNG